MRHVVVVLVLVLAGCTPGRGELTEGPCAEPGAPRLEGPRVTVYGGGEGLLDATCKLVKGDDLGDGCAVNAPDNEIRQAGQGRFVTIEVASNPDTCETLFVTGREP